LEPKSSTIFGVAHSARRFGARWNSLRFHSARFHSLRFHSARFHSARFHSARCFSARCCGSAGSGREACRSGTVSGACLPGAQPVGRAGCRAQNTLGSKHNAGLFECF
jgi:hypothetical protein